MHIPFIIPRSWQSFVDERFSRLRERCREEGISLYDDAGVTEHLERIILASDFAFDTFFQNPQLLGPELISLMSDPRSAEARVSFFSSATNERSQMALLRQFRRREAVRLIWRDLNGLDNVSATLDGSSALAEVCLQTALRWSEITLGERYGLPRNPEGEIQRLVILALGKLGGNELNFSSDIDLIFAYPQNGHTDGNRVVDNETFFLRLAQHLVRLLSDVTVEGYVYRVDLRLRPFGNAGRLVTSFAALENYYQREGRNWERYAWIKARPVAGDLHAGERLLETLRSFVYRHYLDYTAFSGLREMKALINAEVLRKDRMGDIKLGPGGIREIEFIVQLLQLIRGGREPSLRIQGLLSALTACEQRGFLSTEKAKKLREAYFFLRRLENRLQMFRDEQVHELPEDPILRERYALTLGYGRWEELNEHLGIIRAKVNEEYMALLPSRHHIEKYSSTKEFWQRCIENLPPPEEFSFLNFVDLEKAHSMINVLLKSTTLRQLPERFCSNFNAVMPHLLDLAAATSIPDQCLHRLLRLMHVILNHPSYLTLLHEQPRACQRLIDLFSQSEYLAEQVISHPVLLDQLFDLRLDMASLSRTSIENEIKRRFSYLKECDDALRLEILQEEKQSIRFRLGLSYLMNQVSADQVASKLSELAETIVANVLRLAEKDMIQKYGRLNGYEGEGSGLGIIAYGSLGGSECGFNSDLDLVFLYDSTLHSKETQGPKIIDGSQYFIRLAQRVVHSLTTLTGGGSLYEVDVRLRPDGTKGLLVTHLEAFADYQHKRAWTWEHQALIRSRFITGDDQLGVKFSELRKDLLQENYDIPKIRQDIEEMRWRWRREKDRSTSSIFDLKQGYGGLVDIEFLLQALILIHGRHFPEILNHTHTVNLILSLQKNAILSPKQANTLHYAHSKFLKNSLFCTLHNLPRLSPFLDEIKSTTKQVLQVVNECRLRFYR